MSKKLLRQVRPRYLTGDMVQVEPVTAMSFRPGIVVCVRQANSVPDAHIRNMSNIYPWSYWVFFPEGPDDGRSGRGLRGPFLQTELHGVKL